VARDEARAGGSVGVTGIEAMADAIQHHEGWWPGSCSYRNRNPGNLRPYAPGQAVDARGYRVFDTLLDGYAALKADLTAKVLGHTKHNLSETSTLDDLFDVYAPRADYNDPNSYAEDVAHWLTVALGKPCDHNSTLRYVCAELFGG